MRADEREKVRERELIKESASSGRRLSKFIQRAREIEDG